MPRAKTHDARENPCLHVCLATEKRALWRALNFYTSSAGVATQRVTVCSVFFRFYFFLKIFPSILNSLWRCRSTMRVHKWESVLQVIELIIAIWAVGQLQTLSCLEGAQAAWCLISWDPCNKPGFGSRSVTILPTSSQATEQPLS